MKMKISDEMRRQERELRELLNILPNDCPGVYADLKEAAWNVLHENPGIDCGEWINLLLEQYPLEVVDALGTSPGEVLSILEDWWTCNDYEDPTTGLCLSFRDWAEYFYLNC